MIMISPTGAGAANGFVAGVANGFDGGATGLAVWYSPPLGGCKNSPPDGGCSAPDPAHVNIAR